MKKFWRKWLFKISVGVVCLLTAFSSVAPPVKALTKLELDFFAQNNIFFYDPSGRMAGCYVGFANLCGATAAEKIWSGLISLGFTAEQAAGVLGNMVSESMLNPAQWQGGGYNAGFDVWTSEVGGEAFGLIQWDGGRRTRLVNYIKEQAPNLVKFITNDGGQYSDGYRINGDGLISRAGGAEVDSLFSIQLKYLYDEMKGSSSYSKVFDQKTVEESTWMFLTQVERPAGITVSTSLADAKRIKPERFANAERFYSELMSFSCNTSTSPKSNYCGSANGLIEMAREIIHPQYMGNSYTIPKEGYVSLVNKRQSEGAYVGGCDGVDCGGFVTTLIVESGFDPNYNAYNGNTDYQVRWAREHWVRVNPDGPLRDASLLQPGDVAHVPGHTFMYIGDVPGFSWENGRVGIVSASLCSRAPMVGHENIIYSQGQVVEWYRKAN